MGYDIQWGAPHQSDCKDNIIVELPDVVWWNFDNFLMTFVNAGLERLLNGHTAWSDEDRRRLEGARSLACIYANEDVDDGSRQDAGRAALRVVSDMLPRLWD